MKREVCKALLENGVLQAYADGKTITCDGIDLDKNHTIAFSCEADIYSIKKEPQWRPFTKEELKTIVGKVIVSKDGTRAYLITNFVKNCFDIAVIVNDSCSLNNIALFKFFQFVDGSPCGVLE